MARKDPPTRPEPGFFKRLWAKHKERKRKIQEERAKSPHSALRENFVTIVVCAVAAFFVTTYVVHPMTVPTPSMEPTILVGDRLLVDKFTVRNQMSGSFPGTPAHELKRGDIVVFKHPTDITNLWVKRVIGLPGEEVRVINKRVYIDNQPLDEPYAYHSDPSVQRNQRDNFPPLVVPADSYFVMGDNRDNSVDSRFWGVLPHTLIVGRPLVCFWSYADEPDAHLKTGTELLKLYGERIIYFFSRTRWERTGRIIR